MELLQEVVDILNKISYNLNRFCKNQVLSRAQNEKLPDYSGSFSFVISFRFRYLEQRHPYAVGDVLRSR